MPSSNPAQTHDSPPQTDTQEIKPHPQQKLLDPTIEENTQPPQTDSVLEKNQEINEIEGEEEEEESECGFCLYMKAGGCREPFINWEKCIEEGENNKEDIVEKCHSITKALKDCMEANPDHYGPILQAEKAAEEVAMREIEKEMGKGGNVELNSESKVERKESESVAESVAIIEVEEMPNSVDLEQKVAN